MPAGLGTAGGRRRSCSLGGIIRRERRPPARGAPADPSLSLRGELAAVVDNNAHADRIPTITATTMTQFRAPISGGRPRESNDSPSGLIPPLCSLRDARPTGESQTLIIRNASGSSGPRARGSSSIDLHSARWRRIIPSPNGTTPDGAPPGSKGDKNTDNKSANARVFIERTRGAPIRGPINYAAPDPASA